MYWATACAIALATRGAMAEMGCAKEEAKPAAGYNGQLDILTELLEQHKLVESPVVVAHPKITEPPSLMRRKLGSTKWDMIHEGIQGRKREAASCPTDFQLCPASLEGGCCPNDRECGTSSCYSPSTTAIVSACGVAGYVACDLDDGGTRSALVPPQTCANCYQVDVARRTTFVEKLDARHPWEYHTARLVVSTLISVQLL